MGAEEATAFLPHLAAYRHVAPSTQNQALNVLVFVCRHVLIQPLPGNSVNALRSKKPSRLPVVLSQQEVASVFPYLEEPHKTITKILYGSGQRIMEVVRLRVKDIDLSRLTLSVRGSKGNKDRIVPFDVFFLSSFCDAFTRTWYGYSNDSRFAGACGYSHNDDLYARAKTGHAGVRSPLADL